MLVCTLSGIIAVMLAAPASPRGGEAVPATAQHPTPVSVATLKPRDTVRAVRRSAFIPIAAADMPDLVRASSTAPQVNRRERLRFERTAEPVERESVRALRLDAPAPPINRGGGPLDTRLTLRLVGDAGGVDADVGVGGGIAGLLGRALNR